MKRLLTAALILLTLGLSSYGEDSDTYPTRPIILVVPAAPGGGNDALARLLASQIEKHLGQPVVIENRPGGGGVAGVDYVSHAKADGYTILLITTGETYSKALNAAVRFDIVNDFAPIALVSNVPLLLVAKTSQPFSSFQEFVLFAKANAGKVAYGTPGVGTPHHLVGEMLNKAAALKMIHVPYRGTAPAMNDLLADQIAVVWTSPTAAKSLIDAGTVRALALSAQKRSDLMPKIPTLIESGYPSVSLDHWFGIVAPKNTPPKLVRKLDEAIRAAALSPEIRDRLSNLGFQISLSGPEEFADRIVHDRSRYTDVIHEFHLN